MNVYCLYFPNGKRYVGVESKTGHRIASHRRSQMRPNNQPVARAIAKYGWDALKHRYLAQNCSRDDVQGLERFFIKSLDLQNPEVGYNIMDGGYGNSVGFQMKQETRRKISAKLKGRKLPPEVCAKLSAYHKAHPRKIPQAFRDATKVKVLCVETGKIYESLTVAANDVGLKWSTTISKCLSGLRSKAAGFHWQTVT
jgi:group I intron endonuclease